MLFEYTDTETDLKICRQLRTTKYLKLKSWILNLYICYLFVIYLIWFNELLYYFFTQMEAVERWRTNKWSSALPLASIYSTLSHLRTPEKKIWMALFDGNSKTNDFVWRWMNSFEDSWFHLKTDKLVWRWLISFEDRWFNLKMD